MTEAMFDTLKPGDLLKDVLGDIRAVEQITRNGRKWFYQEFDRPDGQLEAINLYDDTGDFVEEFNSYEDMTAYIDRQ